MHAIEKILAKKAGKATITFEGQNGYSGKKSASYLIEARSVNAGHKEVDNGKKRHNNVCQDVLQIPCLISESGGKNKTKDRAGQRDRHREYKLDHLPDAADFRFSEKEHASDERDERDRNVRLDRKEHKDPAAAHERAR